MAVGLRSENTGGASLKFLRLLRTVWVGLGLLALVLALAFLAWRVPGERKEERVFRDLVGRDDGPHVLWLSESTFKVIRVRYERPAGKYLVDERIFRTDDPLPDDVRPLLDAQAEGAAQLPDSAVAVLSDIHGQHGRFVALLRRAGVIDAESRWSWGAGRLVIAGDVFDKGPAVTESLWLIRRLEREAAATGGGVHLLLGNHDHLALTGGSRTVAPKYREVSQALRLPHAQLFGPATELGRWLRRKNTVLKIGQRLFVHAGLSEDVLRLGLTIDDINRLVRASLDPVSMGALSQADRERASALTGATGPLWFGGYFDDSFPIGLFARMRGQLRETIHGRLVLEKALTQYGARQLVVGHTYTRDVRTLYAGGLAAIGVGTGGDDLPEPEPSGQMVVVEADGAFRTISL